MSGEGPSKPPEQDEESSRLITGSILFNKLKQLLSANDLVFFFLSNVVVAYLNLLVRVILCNI